MTEIDTIPSVDEIYEDITGDIAINTALDELDASGDLANDLREDIANESNAGRNRIIAWIVASAMVAQRVLWKLYVSIVRTMAADSQYGTARWYVYKALRFQYGSPVVYTTKDAVYDPQLNSLRIVDIAAVEEAAYKVILKVAKIPTPDSTQPLNSDERAAVQDYFDEVKPSGIRVIVRSASADKVRIYGKVVCDAKQGLANIQSNAISAIDRYLRQLDFNGVFSINQMRQRVLEVPGVTDWQIDLVESRLSSSSTWVSVSRVRRAYAGYMSVDSSYPLTTTLQFISSNV